MKNIKLVILAFFMTAVCGLSGQDAISKDGDMNLIVNGSFEQGTTSGWDFNNASICIDKDSPDAGKQSLKIDGSGKPSFIYGIQSIAAKLKPSTEYVFSVDIKRSSSKGNVMASVVEKAKKDQADWCYHKCELPGGVLDKWEHFSIKFKTENEVADAAVMLYNISSEGMAWFDNVSLIEVKQ